LAELAQRIALGNCTHPSQTALQGHIESMAQSLVSVSIHLIFSTKARTPYIKKEYQKPLFAYLAGIVSGEAAKVYEIGGVEDHVHLLCSLPRTMSLAKMVELLKRSSSRWMKLQSRNLESFAWQHGYGAFSVSSSKRNYWCVLRLPILPLMKNTFGSKVALVFQTKLETGLLVPSALRWASSADLLRRFFGSFLH